LNLLISIAGRWSVTTGNRICDASGFEHSLMQPACCIDLLQSSGVFAAPPRTMILTRLRFMLRSSEANSNSPHVHATICFSFRTERTSRHSPLSSTLLHCRELSANELAHLT